MLNGTTGYYNYWDEAYTGTGDTTGDLAPLSRGLGDLTDGILASGNWDDVEAPPGNGPYVGWQDIDPTITFFFDFMVNFSKIRIHVDDADGNGEVRLPNFIAVSVGETEVTFPIDDLPGPEPKLLEFDISGLKGSSLTLTLFRRSDSWVLLSEVQFESQGKQAVVVSSSVPAQALPVSGTLSEQLDTLNAGPPPFDASWRRANTWSDFHQAASFRCDEVVAPLAQPYVAAETFLPVVGEVTLDNCSSAFYRFTFTLPPDFTKPCLFGVANVDEQAVAFLNGHQISGTMTNPSCEPKPANGATDPCYNGLLTASEKMDIRLAHEESRLRATYL